MDSANDLSMIIFSSPLSSKNVLNYVFQCVCDMFKAREEQIFYLTSSRQKNFNGKTHENLIEEKYFGGINVSEYLVKMLRAASVLHPRSTLLSVKEQQQSLYLSMAQKNKEDVGQFEAPPSDVLALWTALQNRIDTDYNDIRDLDKINVAGDQETTKLLSPYFKLLKSSNSIDNSMLYDAVKDLMKKHFVKEWLSHKFFIVDGIMLQSEWTLLQPLIMLPNVSVYTLIFQNDAKSTPAKLTSPSTEYQPAMGDQLPSADFRHRKLKVFFHKIRTKADISKTGIEKKCHYNTEELLKGKFDVISPTHALSVPLRSQFSNNDGRSPLSHKLSRTTTPSKGISPTTGRKGIWCSTDGIRRSPRLAIGAAHGQACQLYVQQVMVSQIRLLLNTRDYLALATNCSLPGTEMTQDAFLAIKWEAQSKNMPMYQTILSIVQKINLGGEGYKPDKSCPIWKHVKPLSAFVEHISLLSTATEDEPNAKAAALKVLLRIKKYLLHLCNGVTSSSCPLKSSTIEAAHQKLMHKLDACSVQYALYSELCDRENKKRLPPSLELLQSLCDACVCSLSNLEENFNSMASDDNTDFILLSQSSPSTSVMKTPMRVPSVMSLFRSPSILTSASDAVEDGLRLRALKNKKTNTPVRPHTQRFKSCLSWVPSDLSPLQVLGYPDTPVLGPTLVAAAARSGCQRSTEYLQQMIEELPGDDEKQAGKKLKRQITADGEESCTKKRSSKRSLMSDISNLLSNEAGSQNVTVSGKSFACRNKNRKKTINKNIVPQNQTSITSFFKML